MSTKIHPATPDSVHNIREALIGQEYYYLSSGYRTIPYGTYLGVLVYKRFIEPVYTDDKLFVGSYICKFTNYSGVFFPHEVMKMK